jgi:hypothetical protein
VFEAKEQAKYYIEKIRTIGRSTNQTLLIVFIPLFFLYLTQIEPRYVFAEDWITHKKHIDSLKNQYAKGMDTLTRINNTITSINKQLVIKYNDTNERNFYKDRYEGLLSNKNNGYFKKAKKEKAKLSALKMKSYAISDSIKLNLLKLKIPVTLPILNVKLESFSFRFILLLIMFFYTALLWNCYLKKKVIIDTLHKFVEIIKSKFSSTESSLYKDYDFNFPFWFFPIPYAKTANKEQRTFLKIIGIRKRNIPFSNILIYGILLAFLVINYRLLLINWNLNYKVLHSNYSVVNTLSFCFFLFDMILLYLLLRPIIPYKVPELNDIRNSYNRQRRDTIKMALALGVCTVIEPVYGYFDKVKWFQNPRHLQKDNSSSIVFKKGLYLHKKRSKFRNIHYFNNHGKNPCLKTIPKKDLSKFKNNLVAISFSDLISNKKYLRTIEEKDMSQFIRENRNGYDENLKLLTAYINYSYRPISFDIIDLYTRLYATVKPKKNRDLFLALDAVKDQIDRVRIDFPDDPEDISKIKKWNARLKVL